MIQSVAVDLIGFSQPSGSRIFRLLMPILDEVLAHHDPGNLGELAAGHGVLIDGADVPTKCLGGRAHRELFREEAPPRSPGPSGRQRPGQAVNLSEPMPDGRRDIWALQEVGWEEIPRDHTWLADPACIGTNAITPLKKPAGGMFNDHDTAYNKQVSLVHSAVERAIAHLKNWKILATGYRTKLVELPKVIRIATRLEILPARLVINGVLKNAQSDGE